MFSEYPQAEASNPFSTLIEQVNKNPFIRPYETDRAQQCLWSAMKRGNREMTVRELIGTEPIMETVARSNIMLLVQRGVFQYGQKRGTYSMGPNGDSINGKSPPTERMLKKEKMLKALKKFEAEGRGPQRTTVLAQMIKYTINNTSAMLYEMKTRDGTVTSNKIGKEAFWSLNNAKK
jgi:hypothetical protein